MKMIELTQYKTNDPILVNLEKVSSIEPAGSGTFVHFATAQNYAIKESYEEVLKRIAEVNDKQFCLDRRLAAQPRPTLKQRITSAEAVYTGGNQWEFIGELEDGTFFRAYDSDWYEVHVYDKNPADDYEASCFEDWQNEHVLNIFCEDEPETLDFFKNLFNMLPEDKFIDKDYHIEMLEDYRKWRAENCN